MPETLMSRLADALRECSEDLGAEIAGRYGEAVRYHKSEQRAYERDMQPVIRARALLAEWEEKVLRWRQAP